MSCPKFCCFVHISLVIVGAFSLISIVHAQGDKSGATNKAAKTHSDYEKQSAGWFLHGRVVPGKSAADLRRRAYQTKIEARAVRLARTRSSAANATPSTPSGGWTPLGPVPLASDASGSGLQDYHQVSGRATAVAIDPADPSGNTVYIGGAQGGVWKSINAATTIANNVAWTPLTDDQATLSTGAIAIQPGNLIPASSVILVGTGEADNSVDSYFGLGILRSINGGTSWQPLITNASGPSGSVPLSGLGASSIAFSTANVNTVVAAMAATTEGIVDDALTSNTFRGLYTSTDAGQTWTYDALFTGASEATSATSVIYNATAGLFFAALRYHGFYSSPDGLTWTRLANQPGAAGLLSPTACPENYVTTCPIFRADITVVPGRNEMYVWFVSQDTNENTVDQGIWQSLDGGVSWTEISDIGIANCGDFEGCSVEQGIYNLELLAVPNCPNGNSTCTGNPTDLYAGAINLYKCSITFINPSCATTPFLNLTHVYGCNPLAAPAHVHPDQHALAFSIPNAGTSSATDLMYFATDGGIYRALDGFGGLRTGSCSGTNQFDDLNQNLGSMTQFVGFSQDPTDQNTILGGAQDNGSPATALATTSLGWQSVLSGDGGYNAIDPDTGDWFGSTADAGLGTLNIERCLSGASCNDTLFSAVVGSASVGGDDGGLYPPYILDPQSPTNLLVGTCRVWSGSRSGGAFTLLSLNFDSLGIGTCAGTEVNVIRSLATGGPVNADGSQVIYATTDGPGPNNLSSPIGGSVWVTTNAEAVSGTSSTFSNVTQNGLGGASINPNQFPISSVALDTSDASGSTAYVAVMGFTGGPGHVWQTTNAGASWIDFGGSGANAIPDSPANAVVVDSTAHIVYVGTDVGVFQSLTSFAAWTEVGPVPDASGGSSGFLPNVPVTALALFNAGGVKLLRASTYGRGLWQFDLLVTPDFAIAISNSPLTVFQGESATFNGTLTALNGYNNAVQLSCTLGSSTLPSPCTPSPVSLTPTPPGAGFSLTADTGSIADYSFNLQATGSDPNNTTHVAPLTLHVVNLLLSAPVPSSIIVPRGATSPPVSFQLSAQGSFNEGVTLSCGFSSSISGATCAFNPEAVVSLTSASAVNMTATVTVPAGTPIGDYTVTFQATSSEGTAGSTASFGMTVVGNAGADYVITGPQTLSAAPASQVTAKLTFTSTLYSGQVQAACDATTLPATQCILTPASFSLASGGADTMTVTLNIPNDAAPGTYNININTHDITGEPSHSWMIALTISSDFTLGLLTPSSQSITEGQSANYNFSVLPVGTSFTNTVAFSCSGGPEPQCTFTPDAVAPGNSSAAVVMTVSASAASASVQSSQRQKQTAYFALWLALPALAVFASKKCTKRSGVPYKTVSLLELFLLTFLTSCGGGGINGTGGGPGSIGGQQGAQPGTYTIIVTGTSGALSHQASPVTLVVNP